LISITGGRDLTLYEVDEAATRIREEVDQDANIIVGATFDETLEGLIRVAVVATGIDQAVSGRQAAPPETKLAEIAHKLRVDQQRLVDRVERAETPRATPQPAPAASAPTAIESAARAAVAAAVLPATSIEDVTIRPIQPKPSLFPEPANEAPVFEPALPRAFIPPAPDRTAARPPRMPRIDELPLPAQKELRAHLGDAPPADPPEKRRMSLLQRLATVGLGRREDTPDTAESSPARPQQPRPAPRSAERLPPRPARPPEPRGPDPVSEYARRPVHQGLDPQGRKTPVHNAPDEDQLDIPAFLRRQAN
jgi:cell division protein FtsZ